MISQEEFFKVFQDNNVEIDPKAKSFIEQKYMLKGSSMIPFKDVLSKLTWDLSKENPLDHPWIIRKSEKVKRSYVGNDAVSVASSYLFASVLSGKSKRINIDNIIDEEEQIIDRVKKIDDKLKQQGADDVKSNKNEMIQRVINSKPSIPLAPIPESNETFNKKIPIKPTIVSKEEATNQNITIKHNSNEIDILQKLLSNTELLDEVLQISRMLIDSKIDWRTFELIKRGINKEYDDSTLFITVSVFHKYWKNLINPEVDHIDPTIEDKVLHFVTTSNGEKVDKSKLFSLIDFYQYFPFYIQKDKNASKEMYYVLSSNTKGTYDAKNGLNQNNLNKLEVDKELKNTLEYIHDKIKEKYPKMAQAYRFFDVDHKTAITKEEFQHGLK